MYIQNQVCNFKNIAEEIVLNEIEDSRDAMREAFDKQIELQIEALELEIQLKN